MKDPEGLELVRADGDRQLWLHPEVVGQLAGGLPEGPGDGITVQASSGRGALLRVPLADGRAMLLRTYRRGGALRRWLPDRFASARRAEAEVRAVARLAEAGLAPRVLALEVEGTVLKRLRIGIEEVIGARDLLRLSVEEPARLQDVALGRAVGRAVAAMHDLGVAHPDLNAANILVGRAGGRAAVTLLDLDGARLHGGGVPAARRRAEVLRLCRSLDKWTPTALTGAGARAAFVRASLPLGERVRVLRLARRRWRRRHRWGRTGRAWQAPDR